MTRTSRAINQDEKTARAETMEDTDGLGAPHASTSRTPDVPEGFTLGLALVDAVPVILFCLSAITLGRRIGSPLFVIGAVAAFAGGALKVCWKLVIALAHRNVGWLGSQMRYTMSVGFALMLVALVAKAATGGLDPTGAWAAATSWPSSVLLLAWLVCMVAMGYFAGHLDRLDARSNWIEQGTNSLGQAFLLAALLLM